MLKEKKKSSLSEQRNLSKESVDTSESSILTMIEMQMSNQNLLDVADFVSYFGHRSI